MSQIYVCSSYFHVYVSILRQIFSDKPHDESLLILNDHISDFEKLLPFLATANYFDHYVKVPFHTIDHRIKKESLIFSRVLRRDQRVIELVEELSEITKFKSLIKGAEINIFNNRGLPYKYFVLRYKKNFLRLIEDGEGNYYRLVSRFNAFKRRYLLRTAVGAGYDKEIDEILVQFPQRIDRPLQHKAKQLPLKYWQQHLSSEEKEVILGIFLQGIKFNLTGGRKLLLITQPLSEEKFLSEEKKIELYNQLLIPYINKYEIFIKPHPRDMTNYHGKLNYKFSEIQKGFPLEMFNLIDGIHFDVAVTVCSSAIHNIASVDKKVFLGTDYLKNL